MAKWELLISILKHEFYNILINQDKVNFKERNLFL